MDQDLEQFVADLERAIAILTAARDRLADTAPQPSADIRQLVAGKLQRRECLQCGARYQKSGGLGLCRDCYASTHYQLYKTREANYHDLVMTGKIKPKALKTPVRRKRKSAKRQWTALDEHLAEQREKQNLPDPKTVAERIVAETKPKGPKRSVKKR